MKRAGLLLLTLACSREQPTAPTAVDIVVAPDTTVWAWAAGDIASCSVSFKDEATAALVSSRHPEANIFVLGDNVYTSDTLGSYKCYDASWGQFKSRTLPSLGNHEYLAPGAVGYFDYFNGVGVDSGVAGSRAKGYYALTYGNWRIYVLNSEQLIAEQAAWIRTDYAANPGLCQLAVWHRPYITNDVNPRRQQSTYKPLFTSLFVIHAELLLSGHNHNYQRFALKRPDGTLAGSGVRQFVVGTGGGPFTPLNTTLQPGTDRVVPNTYGALLLELGPTYYNWQFFGIDGKRYDYGGKGCH